MHVFLYHADGSSLLGHLNVSESSTVWNTLNICPTGLTNNVTTGKKLLSVVGKGSGLSFTVQIAEGASEIALDEPHTVNVQGDEVSVFQFIPPQGISDKQLDITATSQSNLAAYLKVSHICEDVQENLEVVDYKKESLRLSFATKGRITLSRASIPSLTDSASRWFIGIGLKNVSGDVKFSESKNVTLKLTRSFDYNYAIPVSALLLASLLGGIVVSIVAHFLFKESLSEIRFGGATVMANMNGAMGIQLQFLPPGDQANSNRIQTNLKISGCDLCEVIRYHWFSFGPKTYSYITGIVGNVLMVGAFQFVFANWYTMIQEGNRDNCYYNDFCYRVTNHDIPFNLMISNVSYIVHGLILVVWVLILETKLNVRFKSITTSRTGTGAAVAWGSELPNHVLLCPETNFHILEGGIPNTIIAEPESKKIIAAALKKKYCYSIGYAFSWALVFQGLFSTLYHLCPSSFTFQFDSAFIFIIAGLSVLFLYNGFEQNRCPSSENVKYPVGASNFFLFFIVPLFIFNYFGTLFNSDSGLSKPLQNFFFAFLIIWWLLMVYWAFYKLNIHQGVCRNACNVFLFILGGLVVPLGLFLCFLFTNLSQVFLYTCTICSIIAVLAKLRPWRKLCCCCECRRNCPTAKEIYQRLFIFLTFIVLVGAFGVFKSLPTTSKSSTPENSRDQNEECAFLEFFDWHDLWHFLSSFGVLMATIVIMFLSSEPV